jgi:hypothetical protein
MEVNQIRQLAKRVHEDPEYAKKFSENPEGELTTAAREADEPVYKTDKLIYRMVVIALALVVLIAAVGAIVLVSFGKTTPESLVALGAASIGALAGLLAPSPVKAPQN